MSEKYKNNFFNKKFYIFAFNALVCFGVCGIFIFNIHYSIDDYPAYWNQHDVAYDVALRNYRTCAGFLYYILDILNINTVQYQIVFGCIFVLALTLCITKIVVEINNLINYDNSIQMAFVINLGATLLFLNVYLSEWLYFTFTYIQWTVAVIGSTYAAILIGKTEHLNKNWIIGFLCLFLAAGSYQIVIADYVYIVMFMIFINTEGKINNKFIFYTCRAAMAAGLSILFNILLAKLLLAFIGSELNSRINFKLEDLKDMLFEIFNFQRRIWIDGIGLLPKTLFLIVFLIIFGSLLFFLYNQKVRKMTYICIFLLIFSGQCCIYVSQLMAGSVWIVARVLVPIFGIYTVLIWLLCYFLTDEKINKCLYFFSSFVLLIFFCINVAAIQSNAADVIKTNTLDKLYISEINFLIEKYEKETGTAITEVGFCTDSNITYKYSELINNRDYHGEMAFKAFTTEWSNLGAFNLYTKKNLTKIKVPENIENYFNVFDWNEVCLEEQLIFDGNKLYICVY